MKILSQTLLNISVSGAVLILVILVLRAFLLHKLPKKTFLALWLAALLRLLLPFSIASDFSVYSLIERRLPFAETTSAMETPFAAENPSAAFLSPEPSAVPVLMQKLPETQNQPRYAPALPKRPVSVWALLYCAGAFLCATYFITAYLRLIREFRMSLPVENNFASVWLKEHPLRRPVAIRQSDRILTPLTYGIFRPVILTPKTADWENKEKLSYILLHEYTHIRHYDALLKLVMAAALCIHWFNPMVWAMYFLFNRDIELACDESVIRQSGDNARAAYALTLIGMEEQKSSFSLLCSSFCKNAIEERITSIMKTKKASLLTVVTATVLILCVTTVFATSAKNENLLTDTLQDQSGYSEEERKQLLSLWIGNYESLTVSGFRQTMHDRLPDTPEMIDLIERFSQSESVRELPDSAQPDALLRFKEYFFSIFEPLTAEKWQTRSFSGDSLSDTTAGGQASLEYVLTLTIQNADALTVAEYDQTRRQAIDELNLLLTTCPPDTLADTDRMEPYLQGAISSLEKHLSNEKITLSVAYAFFPLSDYKEEALLESALSESEKQWDTVLSPYAPYGLIYEYTPDKDGNGLKMYYQNREIRSIIDPEKEIWITEHTGISAYADDATELYAVYENGQLTGLRFATTEEQQEWTKMRQDTTNEYMRSQKDGEEAEPRAFPNATDEDYASLLALKTSNYQDLSVADFDRAVLDWCSEDYKRMERIGTDTALEDYTAALTEEEKSFAAFTFALSREENYRMVTSWQTGEEEKEALVRNARWSKNSEQGNGAWCTLDYQFSYRISDKERLTVGERDRRISGVMQGIQKFWEEHSLRELLQMSEQDVVEYFQTLTEEYSNELLTITIDEDQVLFQHRKA